VTTQLDALNEAIAAAESLRAFAATVGAPSTYAVKAWRITQVPERYCPRIERAYGVRCERLRPDVDWAFLRGTAA